MTHECEGCGKCMKPLFKEDLDTMLDNADHEDVASLVQTCCGEVGVRVEYRGDGLLYLSCMQCSGIVSVVSVASEAGFAFSAQGLHGQLPN